LLGQAAEVSTLCSFYAQEYETMSGELTPDKGGELAWTVTRFLARHPILEFWVVRDVVVTEDKRIPLEHSHSVGLPGPCQVPVG
jgi:hypothetical protein